MGTINTASGPDTMTPAAKISELQTLAARFGLDFSEDFSKIEAAQKRADGLRHRLEGSFSGQRRFDCGELNIPGRLKNIDREIDRMLSLNSDITKTEDKAAAALARVESATAKAVFSAIGAQMIDSVAPGYAARLGLSLSAGRKEAKKTLERLAKFEPETFFKIVQKFEAEQAAKAA